MSVIFSLGIKDIFKPQTPVNNLSRIGFSLEGNNGSTVMLIHGLTGTPNEMRFLGGYLNRKGYSVICPRLANHGQPMAILKRTTWQKLYGSLREAFMEELSPKAGPIFISGLSMGALFALLLADEFKDRVSGVSCLAPTLFYDGWNTPPSKYLLPLAMYTPIGRFFYFKEAPPYGIKNETIQQRIHKYYSNAKLKDIASAAQYGYAYFPVPLLVQLRLLVKYLEPRLPNMKMPAQFIQAKDDDVASVKNSKFLYDRVGSQVKEIILLYNSYHVITADHERDIVAEKMDNFFTRVQNETAAEHE